MNRATINVILTIPRTRLTINRNTSEPSDCQMRLGAISIAMKMLDVSTNSDGIKFQIETFNTQKEKFTLIHYTVDK